MQAGSDKTRTPRLDTATIYQVAETAQVSVRTVSRYLNDPSCVSAKKIGRAHV